MNTKTLMACFSLLILVSTATAQTSGRSETATFAGGCFWCTEAIFQELAGVQEVTAGMMGGQDTGLTERQIARGEGGHAEVVQIVFDPSVLPYEDLLEVFFATHDPTSVNKQGADEGVEYRSAIFYHSDAQKATVEAIITGLSEEQVYPKPIVTEVTAATVFHKAAEDHQNYYTKKSDPGYCEMVITPKVEKFRKVFADRLKTGSVAK